MKRYEEAREYLAMARWLETMAVEPTHEEELAALQAKRAEMARKEAAGLIMAPDGSWIPLSTWKAHIRLKHSQS